MVQPLLILRGLEKAFGGVTRVVGTTLAAGGQRTLAGPVLGAVIMETVSEALRAYGQIRMVLFALVVLGMMWLYPLGLVGMAPAAVATGPFAWRVLRARTRTLHL